MFEIWGKETTGIFAKKLVLEQFTDFQKGRQKLDNILKNKKLSKYVNNIKNSS